MDSLIASAIARPFVLTDLNLGDIPSPQEVRAFCNSFAHVLVDQYLRGDLPWTDADAAANHIYELMIQHTAVRGCRIAHRKYFWRSTSASARRPEEMRLPAHSLKKSHASLQLPRVGSNDSPQRQTGHRWEA